MDKNCGNCKHWELKADWGDAGRCNKLSSNSRDNKAWGRTSDSEFISYPDFSCNQWAEKEPEQEEFVKTNILWNDNVYTKFPNTDITTDCKLGKYDYGYRLVGFVFQDKHLHHNSPIHILRKSNGNGWDIYKASHALWRKEKTDD